VMCVYLGLCKGRKGYTVMTVRSRKILEGVWDVFFVTDSYPLAEERDRKLAGHVAPQPSDTQISTSGPRL
jgi:hypothetical protein